MMGYGQSKLKGSIGETTKSMIGNSTYERPSVNIGGCKVNSRSVRKYGSVKAILLENERMTRAGITIIHPYSTFRLVWDSMTLVGCSVLTPS